MNFFLKLNFKLNFTELLTEIRANKLEWIKHGHNMPTAVLPELYSNEIKKIINLEEETQIYVHNLLPLAILSKTETPYLTSWHIDNHRKSSILIQVSEDNPNHYAEFRKGNVLMKAPYTQGVPLLFNVKQIHRAQNTDNTISRNILSIPYRTNSYEDLCSRYNNGTLINYDNFEDNLFRPQII